MNLIRAAHLRCRRLVNGLRLRYVPVCELTAYMPRSSVSRRSRCVCCCSRCHCVPDSSRLHSGAPPGSRAVVPQRSQAGAITRSLGSDHSAAAARLDETTHRYLTGSGLGARVLPCTLTLTAICSRLQHMRTCHMFTVWYACLTATEALEHPWLRGKASSEMLPPEVIRTLHSFDAANKFQQHALHLMVSEQ